MVRDVQAIYEHGSLRLLEPVSLQEGERVTVSIESAWSPPPPEAVNAILDRIAALPVPDPNDRFSGEDHDKVLYGWEDRE